MSNWQEARRHQDRVRREAVMRLPVLQVRRHGVIDGQDGDVRVCASVGPDGELVAVWTTAEDLEAVTSRTVSAGGATFPDPDAARPVAARITVHAPELAAVTRVQELALALAHITVQPMPGDRFLVAGARCRWRRDGPDRNAVLYDADGQVVSEHVLGDGIEHVLATSTGQVWVGYFDEGIYGNYGWAGRIARSRLARTGSSGSLRDWSLPGTIPNTPRSGRGSRLMIAMPSTLMTRASGPAITPISRSCASATIS